LLDAFGAALAAALADGASKRTSTTLAFSPCVALVVALGVGSVVARAAAVAADVDADVDVELEDVASLHVTALATRTSSAAAPNAIANDRFGGCAFGRTAAFIAAELIAGGNVTIDAADSRPSGIGVCGCVT